MEEPRVVLETPSCLVLDKPHGMHTAPLHEDAPPYGGDPDTLLGWCALRYPEVRAVRGRKPVEGGLVHRLDYETAGLVLVARTQAAYDALAAAQDAGRFLKDYRAVTRQAPAISRSGLHVPAALPFVIESGFRHYGPGRKRVKPCPPGSRRVGGGFYTTHVMERRDDGGDVVFRVRLARGFRHQVRAHLAWIGCPVNNDRLYGGAHTGGPLGLIACRLQFPDPGTQAERVVTAASAGTSG